MNTLSRTWMQRWCISPRWVLQGALRLGLYLALCMLAGPVVAVPPTLQIEAAAAQQSLSDGLLVIPDRGRELDVDAVMAGDHDHEAVMFARKPPNIGYPRHDHWVRLRLHNPSAQSLERLLVLWRGAAHAQTLHIEDAQGRREVRLGRGGDRIGDVDSPSQAARVRIAPGGGLEVTARVSSRVSLVLDYRLLSELALSRHDAFAYATFGVQFGAVLSIGLFVLAIWVGMRERMFLWFAGFAIGILIYQLHAEAYLYMLLGPGWQVPGSYLSAYAGAISSVCVLLLVRDFLAPADHLTRLDRRLVAPLIVGHALVFPLFPIAPWLGNTVIAAAVALTGVAMVGMLLHSLFRRSKGNRPFFYALLLHSMATTMFLLKRAGVIPEQPLLIVIAQSTTVLAVVMFAVAISQRVRSIAQENRDNQQRYAQRLEQEVAERTLQYREATERAEHALDGLRQAQQQMVEQEKMASLGSLVAGVAHEVNTPLGVALTASSHLGETSHRMAEQFQTGTLRKSELQSFIGTAEESTSLIERNLARAAHLIQSFKQVSVDRTSDGRRRFVLHAFISELIDSLKPSWKQRPIELVIDCPDKLAMDSFPGALGQVLTNFVQNALLHAFERDQPGAMRIVVVEIDERDIEVRFSDNGKGASDEVIRHIFEPFFTTRRNQGGTGLGMHVAYNLVVQKLGGSIQVDGAPGAGLRFVLRLPRSAPDSH